ncbi:unnamed protein product [Ambrosiozyma monospora]|uniref:Putative tyrosine-protein phosphatase OCA1 n=1 Tax=Ambrosiozyma monospora TaxID=43982 RepID=A0A9W6YRY9_AMBMO|nr:unnamed protein product [Ambrosiozyma monospora]
MLVPPDNFALVEEGIYRCTRLDAVSHPLLDTLNLKSILWLDEEKPPRPVANYIDSHKLKLFHLKNLPEEDDNIANVKSQDWMVLKPVLVSKIFQFLLDYKNNHNCLLVDSSEVVVGILRHIQKWSYSSISNEYRLYSNYKANYSVENYLELINIELIPYEALQRHPEEEEDYIESEDVVDDFTEDALTSADETNMLSPVTRPRRESVLEDPEIGSLSLSEHTTRSAISIKPPVSSTSTRGTLNPIGMSSGSQTNSNGSGRNNSVNNNLLYANSANSSSSYKRRVSFVSPKNSLTSSKMSMSTSPQIPHQLLKLVELRKQKKKQREQQEQDLNKESQRYHQQGRHNHHRHHRTQSQTQQNRLDRAPILEGKYYNSANGNARLSIDGPIINGAEGSLTLRSKGSQTSLYSYHIPQYYFYQSRTDFYVINDKKKRINTTIRIKLPKEENLPQWFIDQRDMWEEEYQELLDSQGLQPKDFQKDYEESGSDI